MTLNQIQEAVRARLELSIEEIEASRLRFEREQLPAISRALAAGIMPKNFATRVALRIVKR